MDGERGPGTEGAAGRAASEERLRDLLDRLPQAIFEMDLAGRFSYVSRAGLDAFGYTAEELRGGLFARDMVVQEQRERLRGNLGRRLAGGPPEYFEYTALRKDGGTFPILVSTVVVQEAGQPIGFQGFLIDISERKRAEAALRESEGKYKALVEMTTTGFVILDAEGRVLDANAEYVRLTGRRSLPEILGRPVTEWTSARDLERNAREVRRCFERGFVRDLQVDYVHADGTLVPVEINAAVVEAGDARQIITVIRDISERRRLEEEQLRSEKLHSVGVLAGGIAHDFNNILTAVLGNISLLRETIRPTGQAAELLAEAEQASFRARELTRQLLTFSRGGAPVRKPFHPGALIRESATLALRGRGTACDLRIAADLRPIDADEGQIGQVINNLVINASQAMAGGGTVVVEARNAEVREGDSLSLSPGSYLAVAVSDRGAGIPEQHRGRIFDPYFTTKQEGSGLGLAVSFAIAADHGGTITMSSEIGRGAVFTVYLPAPAGIEPERRGEAAPPVRGRGRVLLMDDEAMVRTVASKILRALGYEVEQAADGREALELWRRARDAGRPFDIALVDLTVPGGMGGREALRELLALDPAAQVVVSSGSSQDPVVANFREHGFQDVLAKPYSVAEISRVLSRLLPGP